jgi:hypothetical protein
LAEWVAQQQQTTQLASGALKSTQQQRNKQATSCGLQQAVVTIHAFLQQCCRQLLYMHVCMQLLWQPACSLALVNTCFLLVHKLQM